ncbi:MAG: amidohydrolase, partial [Bacteroidetes bacterium]|nr:amidohydrolase [Bacteroidota bacterium]
MKIFSFFLSILVLFSCGKKKDVDMIVLNGNIHLMDSKLQITQAIVIDNGIIIDYGSNKSILKKYISDTIIDVKKRDVYPGFHDCHGHLCSYAKQMMTVDLRGTRSYYELIARVEKFLSKEKPAIIIGRGWDQSLWGVDDLPDNKRLNESYPNTPVALTRVDGHAMLINQAMMDLMGINIHSKIEGGAYLKEKGKLTGIILDNAVDELNKRLPKFDKNELKRKFLMFQELLLSMGITHVHDAGFDEDARDLFIELANEKKLKINIYGMLFPTPGNIEFAKKFGHYTNGRLTIRSFKVIADGALGSRGACLLQPYSDDPLHYGLMVTPMNELSEKMMIAKELGYQINTHCIGDSANRVVLKLVDSLMKGNHEHRWRIEHAQVINPVDLALFGSTGLIPSVQPTHVTTDQRWAEFRLGKERMEKEAYLYKTLCKTRGIILFGTDFPIEDYNPFATIYAATMRKNTDNEPQDGFMINEAVSFDTAILAMTAWAAYGCFAEKELGTLEVGKKANLVILNYPLKKNVNQFHNNSSWMTIIDGKIVF